MTPIRIYLTSLGAVLLAASLVATTKSSLADNTRAVAVKPGPSYAESTNPTNVRILALEERVSSLEGKLVALQRDHATHTHLYLPPQCQSYESLDNFRAELARGGGDGGDPHGTAEQVKG